MQLQNQFRVALSVEGTWALLTDLPRVARCLPGAAIDDVVDGEYRGNISTRIGPISARYSGTAYFREQDEVSHRAVIEARGREDKGSGSAQALITAVLKPEGHATLVDVTTELTISGRAAQFGRSLLAEVSNSMVAEFVRRLEVMITEQGATASAPLSGSTTDQATSHDPSLAEGNQLDLVSTIAMPLVKRHAREVAVAVGIGAIGYFLGFTSGRRSPGRRRAPVPALCGNGPADVLRALYDVVDTTV